MEISLPLPIEKYVRAENSGDVDSMAECFAPYATVRDEGRYIEGRPAIRAWRARTKRKYYDTVTPLEISRLGGSSVLKAKLSGAFPGSPVTANFHFVLENDRIASLQIRG
jgi:hypothetical protein